MNKPKEQVERAIEMLLLAPPRRGKATFITKSGIYQADHNYNPPKVIKIELDKEDK